MTTLELREAKVDLLDSIHMLASEPVPDLEGAKKQVEEIFSRLERMVNGEKEGTPER